MNPEKQKAMENRKLFRKVRGMLCMGEHPMLKAVCRRVGEEELAVSGKMEVIFKALSVACLAFDTCVGIAAPQMGFDVRVIAIWPLKMTKAPASPQILINPEIVDHSETTNAADEMCLSYPGVKTRVARWDWVGVKFTHQGGGETYFRYSGFASRVVQHEVDHLDGKCDVKNGSTLPLGECLMEAGRGGGGMTVKAATALAMVSALAIGAGVPR